MNEFLSLLLENLRKWEADVQQGLAIGSNRAEVQVYSTNQSPCAEHSKQPTGEGNRKLHKWLLCLGEWRKEWWVGCGKKLIKWGQMGRGNSRSSIFGRRCAQDVHMYNYASLTLGNPFLLGSSLNIAYTSSICQTRWCINNCALVWRMYRICFIVSSSP